MCDVVEERAHTNEEEHGEQDRHAENVEDVANRHDEQQSGPRKIGGDEHRPASSTIEEGTRGEPEEDEGDEKGQLQQRDCAVTRINDVDGDQGEGNVRDL